MSKFDKLLKSINSFIDKADDDISEDASDFPGLEDLQATVDDFEADIASLLRDQKKRYVDEFKSFVSKDDKETIEAYLAYIKKDMFAADEFAEEFGEKAASFLDSTVEDLARAMMESIDPDIPLRVLSKSTTDWINRWSMDLADIMEVSTHKALEDNLLTAIEEGESIADVELRMKNMSQFDRNRARVTARTEILTASSRAHYESFKQSPSVTGKQWKHSGGKKITPRESHVAMDGTVIELDEYFVVDGEEGLYPRDVTFSAKNRANCGCALGPQVDESISRLSKEEKEEIRQEVLEEMNA